MARKVPMSALSPSKVRTPRGNRVLRERLRGVSQLPAEREGKEQTEKPRVTKKRGIYNEWPLSKELKEEVLAFCERLNLSEKEFHELASRLLLVAGSGVALYLEFQAGVRGFKSAVRGLFFGLKERKKV